jgi:hypothetical protein
MAVKTDLVGDVLVPSNLSAVVKKEIKAEDDTGVFKAILKGFVVSLPSSFI